MDELLRLHPEAVFIDGTFAALMRHVGKQRITIKLQLFEYVSIIHIKLGERGEVFNKEFLRIHSFCFFFLKRQFFFHSKSLQYFLGTALYMDYNGQEKK